jgi:hypothetical protein
VNTNSVSLEKGEPFYLSARRKERENTCVPEMVIAAIYHFPPSCLVGTPTHPKQYYHSFSF